MRNAILITLFSFLALSCKERSTYVALNTTAGEIILKLYDETPLHKENFIKLVEEGYYDGILFHRVMNNFMIQAGDPKSKEAIPGQQLGFGGPGYTIPAEFSDSLYHKKGALATANDGNAEKASSGSQFYIVEGKKFTDKELEAIEKRSNHKFLTYQKEYYKTIGGYPPLDQNYTVFGEVVSGMNIVEKISDVKTDKYNRPNEDVKIISAQIIKFKEKE